MTAALDEGAVDLINLPTLDFLSIRDRYALEPALVGVYDDGHPSERFVLVVHGRSGFVDLADLKGVDLLVGIAGDERIWLLWLDVLLARQGRPESGDHFRRHSVETASAALLPVFFGQKEICVVDERAFETMAELNPQIGQQLVIMATSPDLLTGLLAISPSSSPGVRRLTVSSGTAMHEKTQGQHILELFGMQRVVPFKPEYLDSVVSLVEEHEQTAVGSGDALRKGP